MAARSRRGQFDGPKTNPLEGRFDPFALTFQKRIDPSATELGVGGSFPRSVLRDVIG